MSGLNGAAREWRAERDAAERLPASTTASSVVIASIRSIYTSIIRKDVCRC